MSTIEHGYFPRSAMDMDQWNRPVVGSPQPWMRQAQPFGQHVDKHVINTKNMQPIETSKLNSSTMGQQQQPLSPSTQLQLEKNGSSNGSSNGHHHHHHHDGQMERHNGSSSISSKHGEQSYADQWKKQLNTLDMFDPFDALDHTIGRNMQWLSRPEFMMPQLPRVPQKYRVTLDCTGYKPSSIKTEWKSNQLTVSGREEQKDETGDFHVKEFKKTYTMPPHAECDKMVSFMTKDGQLVIEVPLKETEKHMNTDLFPQVCDAENGGKVMKMKFTVPENIQPEHIHINIKDRCLVVKAEEKKVKPDGVSTFHYYKKTTLPENTAWDDLKCSYDNHQISVTAPLNLEWTPTKQITWDNKHGSHDQHYHQAGQQMTGGAKCPFGGKQSETMWAGKHGETAWPGKA